ncbi:hypothetical protein Hypma_013535 [Hypsizygus marmoreus]|uniref:Uncharacterized protein n=1 Tax=Hypsizygus marmoreus TaxID=39966 RepID=A0A369JD36_HYPMA|nr:hypothetical protein Hypma_013535 [Hypsizygus marmoreus]
MAPKVAAYSSAQINDLVSEGAALGTFEADKVSEVIYGALKDVFAKHSATKFGLRLIYKPSSTAFPNPNEKEAVAEQKDAAPELVLKDGDRLIRAGNVALVADISTLSQETLDQIVPVAWGFNADGSIFPFEFTISADSEKDKLTSADLAFIADAQAIVAGKPYSSILGLSLAAYQPVGVKSTIGAVSFTLPFEFVDLFGGDTRHETAWGFVDGELQVQGLVCSSRGAQSYGNIYNAPGGQIFVNNYYPGGGFYYPRC